MEKGVNELMKEIALVVMAAGLGSRFGEGIKQLEPMGPNGEIIMDYAIFDALEAGFNKVVFIIRKDIEEDFKKIIGDRISKKVNVSYVFQEKSDLPDGFSCPGKRTKPWGTGHAVLCAAKAVSGPFAVINADDYYGKEAFVKLYQFLSSAGKEGCYCMAGFILKNTLSENGGVTRGISRANADGELIEICETREIARNGNGKVVSGQTGQTLDENSYVSMNMWGFTKDFLDKLQDSFEHFLKQLSTDNELTAEFLLPDVVAGLLKNGQASVKVLETNDKWFGVTHKEDKELFVSEIQALINRGIYPVQLF